MKIKALALVSGGLDSLLAAKLIQDQGIEVTGVHFKIPFCKLDIKKSFPDIGIKLLEFDLGAEFLSLIRNPRYGFGSNMNPCIDCKILMFTKAKELLSELRADFIVTGEVLGQRPMSQNKQALGLIKQRSGLDDLLLRPLSAQFFPLSLPEREGWVKRDKLLNFNGRMRTPQMQLAKKLGISKYANPAGGCLLTDPCFSKRLEELLWHEELSLDNLVLLRVGRHFRIEKKSRLVVGRNENENRLLAQLAMPGDYLFFPQNDLAGPTSLARGPMTQELIYLSSQITSAYSDTIGLKNMEVSYRNIPETKDNLHKVDCLPKSRFVHLLV
ncbi:MAG: tRNA 4-thiouridine(8) synthase ThiI [Candidatus Omnitrophica bacterium]|nr:tRNA 4-thiouridine(8) synthase ThiI [Candidatus Omnitrophota bacterium]MBU1922672.1 tRNA 4-thiouridine(8) synthase ThiI [Candidatus Omnitrophota bacterium]